MLFRSPNQIDSNRCRDISDQIQWLERDSPAHRVLCEHIRSENFLSQLRLAAHGQHTGKLEVLHSMMLAYAPKRIDFEPSAYNGRIKISVLDHNENVQRPIKTGKRGKAQYRLLSAVIAPSIHRLVQYSQY